MSTPSADSSDTARESLEKLVHQTNILRARLASFEGFSAPSRVLDDISKSSQELIKDKPTLILPPRVENLISNIKFEIPQIAKAPQLEQRIVKGEPKKATPLSPWELVLQRADSFLEACYKQTGNIQNKVLAYGERIIPLNNARLSGSEEELLNVVRDFSKVSRATEYELRADQMTDCWKLTESICAHPERSIIHTAVKFLESLYLRHVEKILAQFPRDALLIGRPTIIERVKAFVGIKIKRMPPQDHNQLEMAGGVAYWAVLFYLLRTGHVAEALQYSRQIETLSSKGTNESGSLSSFIEAYYQDMISPSIRAQIQAEYNQRNMLGNQDIYLLAILKVLGNCDPVRRTFSQTVFQTSEDWLWLQFKMHHQDYYDLKEIQSAVQKIKLDTYLTHFQFYLLTKQIGKAVECLWSTEFGKVDSVHFIIVFYLFGLLKSDVSLENLFGDGKDIVNLPLIIAIYNKCFIKKFLEPNLSVYYFLIVSGAGVSEDAISQSIIESGNYAYWLGDVQQDGSTLPGALASYNKLVGGGLTTKVVTKAAFVCQQQNRLHEAFQLLNLSGSVEKVLDLVNETLVKFLLDSSRKNEDHLRTCQAVVEFYGNNSAIMRQLSRSDYQKSLMLLRLVEFKKLVSEKDYERALSTVEILDMLPLKGDISEASRLAESVKFSGDSDLLIYLPEVAVLTMQCILAIYGSAARLSGLDVGRQQAMKSLQGKAKSLLTFASLLQHRMPPEYLTKMTKMELSML